MEGAMVDFVVDGIGGFCLRGFGLGLVVAFVACQRIPEEPSRLLTEPASASGNHGKAAGPACPVDPEPNFPKLPVVTLKVAELPSVAIEAEVATSSEETQRGLMYRTAMAENHGMIFKLERQVHSFWMRNTCISLDMAFAKEDGTIVGILENVPVLNDESRTVGQPSTYVLEMNGGWMKSHDLRPGQKLVVPASLRLDR